MCQESLAHSTNWWHEISETSLIICTLYTFKCHNWTFQKLYQTLYHGWLFRIPRARRGLRRFFVLEIWRHEGIRNWNSAGMGDFRSGNISTWDRQECIIFLENAYFVDVISSDLCVSRFVAFKLQSSGHVFLKSAVSFTSALSFLSFLQLLKHGKWNCSYRASKSRRNTDMGGWLFPPTFTFATSARYCCLYLTNTMDAMVTVWLTSQQNPKCWNVFDCNDNAGWGFAQSWKVLGFHFPLKSP